MQNTQTDISKAREALIASLGINYKATFVPFSQSRNKKEKNPSLNWIVTLSRGRRSLNADYMQGIGHLKGYKQAFGQRMSLDEKAALDFSAEHGTAFSFSRVTEKQPDPSLTDVLYSLCMDADVLDADGFEGWADDYGYDADSRKAEAIYRACIDISLKFRAMLGDDNLTKLRELFQDY
jgi:hypothetical protein